LNEQHRQPAPRGGFCANSWMASLALHGPTHLGTCCNNGGRSDMSVPTRIVPPRRSCVDGSALVPVAIVDRPSLPHSGAVPEAFVAPIVSSLHQRHSLRVRSSQFLRADGESARRDMHTCSVHVNPSYFVWLVQPILLHPMTAQGPESGMLTSGKVHASRSSKSSIWWSPLSDETGNFGTAAA